MAQAEPVFEPAAGHLAERSGSDLHGTIATRPFVDRCALVAQTERFLVTTTTTRSVAATPSTSSVLYDFIPVDARWLDGDGRTKDFKRVTWKALETEGLDVASLRQTRGLTTHVLNMLERDELLALGLSVAIVDAVLRARGPHAS